MWLSPSFLRSERKTKTRTTKPPTNIGSVEASKARNNDENYCCFKDFKLLLFESLELERKHEWS